MVVMVVVVVLAGRHVLQLAAGRVILAATGRLRRLLPVRAAAAGLVHLHRHASHAVQVTGARAAAAATDR